MIRYIFTVTTGWSGQAALADLIACHRRFVARSAISMGMIPARRSSTNVVSAIKPAYDSGRAVR